MSVLDRIFEERRRDTAEAKLQTPLPDLEARIALREPCRGFLDALKFRNKPVGLIAEIKPASPSRGLIRPDLDAGLLAQHYAWAGAHALSVLTEPRHFGGSAENLIAARQACPLPVLRKDFLDDPYQVYEARSWGADAVLLIVAALSPDQLAELLALTEELGMDALVEVHDERELDTAVAAGAKLIGINSRNLKNLETDLSVIERILPMIPEGTLSVAESALETSEDVARMQRAGADAVLIGTAFCLAPDVEKRIHEVMGW